MTYRDLLEAIDHAEMLRDEVNAALNNPKRYHGTVEERDLAEIRYMAAEAALDEKLPYFKVGK